MKVLIKSAKIIDPDSKFNNKKRDILISNGKITSISEAVRPSDQMEIVDIKGLHVSPGWFDLYSCFFDPGYEVKEDLGTGSQAASQGGFTGVACMPTTNPALHSKSEIEYVVRKTAKSIVDVHPVGAVSHGREGKDITEMYDMQAAGAIAFSDADRPIADAGLMLRSLMYVKPFGGVIYSNSNDISIADNGLINEGEVSTKLGLPGLPSLAEELMVSRDIYLAEYSDSKVHFPYISCKRSVDLIKAAKAKGLKVTASVAAHSLLLEESVLLNYDPNYKVHPPLRSSEDTKALINGLAKGTLDAICSQHIPHEDDAKKVEFEYAAFGIVGLESAFAVANTSLRKELSIQQLVGKFSDSPKKILGLPTNTIEKGAVANLTLFDPAKKWTFTEQDIRSKSKNSPFIGTEFYGKPLGIVNNDQLFIA